MPDIVDILGFVLSIISLVGLHQLKELIARRLPPGRLQTIKADLGEMRELLEHLEYDRYRDGLTAADVHQFRSSLQRLDVRAANLWLEVDICKEKGVLQRYVHRTERIELSRSCQTLHRDVADLRAHLHKLQRQRTQDRDDAHVQATTFGASSSNTAAVSEPSFTAASDSSTAAPRSPTLQVLSVPEAPLKTASSPPPAPAIAYSVRPRGALDPRSMENDYRKRHPPPDTRIFE